MTKTAWVRMLGGRVEYVDGQYRTRCLHTGGGDSPPLVLIHGIGGHAESFLKNMLPLGSNLSDRDIYAIDLIGHGFSDKPGEYLIPNYATHVEDFIESIGHDRAHIHGESLGGWIATWIGANNPGIAETVGLNTTAGVSDSIQRDVLSDDAYERQRAESQDLVDRTREMMGADYAKELVRRRVNWLFHGDPPEEVVDIRYHIYQQESVKSHMGAVYGADRQYFDEDVYENIQVPALLIHSTHNPGTPPETIEYVNELIPVSEYHLYDQSAHWPQWEQADLFNRHTAEFISDYESR